MFQSIMAVMSVLGILIVLAVAPVLAVPLALAAADTPQRLASPPAPARSDSAGPSAASLEPARGATVSGLLRSAPNRLPLAGLPILLGGAQQVTTGPEGRFRFEGVSTGVYRLIVLGACDHVPPRVDVRPGESIEVVVDVDTTCSHPRRLYEPGRLPRGVGFQSWPVEVAEGVEAQDLIRPLLEVVAEALGSGSDLTAILAAPHGIRTDIERLVPRARPVSENDGEWVVLVEPGCFAPSTQLTITATGSVFLRLVGSPIDDPKSPVLRREACASCVEHLFVDLRRAGLHGLSGLYAAPWAGDGDRTIAGVLEGKPFLIRTSGLNLAIVEAFRTRILDLCAYGSCIDTSAMSLYPLELRIDAPDSVAAGSEFEIRTRASSPELLAGAAVRVEVEGAILIGGESGKAGPLDAKSPIVIAGRYRAPRPASWEKGRRDIVVRARFAAEYGVPLDPAGALQSRRIRVR